MKKTTVVFRNFADARKKGNIIQQEICHIPHTFRWICGILN